MEEEKIKSIYKGIRYREEITEEELEEKLEENIIAIYLAMDNFDDRLCSRMKERVEQVKEYIEILEKEKQQVLDDYQDLGKDLANNFISKEVIIDKIEELRKKHNNVFDSQTILKEILGGTNE